MTRKLKIYYFNRRFFDPHLQRWLNRDPVQERGGLNLYGYCGNDPVDQTDPSGLAYSWGDWLTIQEHHNYAQKFWMEFAELEGGGINVHAAENLTGLPAWAHISRELGIHSQNYNSAWYNFFYDSNGGRIAGRTVDDARAYLANLKSSPTYKPYFDIGVPLSKDYDGYTRVQAYIDRRASVAAEGISAGSGTVRSFGVAFGAFALVAGVLNSEAIADELTADMLTYVQDSQDGSADGDAWAYVDLLQLRYTLNQAAPFAGDVAMSTILAKEHTLCK